MVVKTVKQCIHLDTLVYSSLSTSPSVGPAPYQPVPQERQEKQVESLKQILKSVNAEGLGAAAWGV